MKILFFDYWLKGIANFNRLMPELRRQCPEAEVKMLHVGSWKETQESIVNVHDGFISYDISYYQTWSLFKVLKKEKPDVLVLLNLYYLSDKALIVFCKHLGIKTVYLAHGKFSTIDDGGLSEFLKQDLKRNFVSKIRRDTVNTLLNYFHSTWLEYRPLRFIKSVIGLLRNPASMTLNSMYTDELDANLKLVYYESDKQVLIGKRNFPDKDIYVVGNPELDSFINTPLMARAEYLSQIGLLNKPYLLYLDDGYVQARLLDKDEWHSHLIEIAEIVKKVNMQFVIKLHPRTPLSEHTLFFIQEGIIPFGNEVDFKNLIVHSDTVTSFVSTTISFALLLGKRVISPRWGVTAELAKVYPDNVIHYSENIFDFAEWLVNKKPCNISTDYVKKSLGLLDGKAIERIINQILNI